MAEESAGEAVVNETEKNVQILANNDNTCRNQWVSFEEECEVPLLPQPPSHGDNMNSEKYIDRLEQKLRHIKNPSNVTGKNIVSALTEARASQMNNLMNETEYNSNASLHQTYDDLNWDDEIAQPRCCCLVMYNRLFPKQAKTTQEVECLLDEDELALVNSEYAGRDLATQQAMMT